MSADESHRRKRQRLSSPTYEDQVVLSQEDVRAFDDYLRASQQVASPFRPSQRLGDLDRQKRDRAIAAALGLKSVNHGDAEDSDGRPPSPTEDASYRKENRSPRWNASTTPSRTSSEKKLEGPSMGSPHAAAPRKSGTSGFTSALETEKRFSNPIFGGVPTSSPDPVAEDEAKLAAWFQSDNKEKQSGPTSHAWFDSKALPSHATIGFQTAKNAQVSDERIDTTPTEEEDWFASTTLSDGTSIGFMPARDVKSAHDKPETSRDLDSITSTDHPLELQVDGPLVDSAGPSAAMVVGFQKASAFEILAESFNPQGDDTTLVDDTSAALDKSLTEGPSAFMGFTTGSGILKTSKGGENSILMPSAAALEAAERKMKQWQSEMDNDFNESSIEDADFPGDISTTLLSATEVILPESPSPAGLPIPRTEPRIQPPLFPSQKPFKPPFRAPKADLSTAAAWRSAPEVASPLNPQRPPRSYPPVEHGPVCSTPLPAAKITAPSRFTSPFVSPVKPALGITPRRSTPSQGVKRGFVTPFKAGMRPGEPGRLQLQRPQEPGSPLPKPIGQGVVRILHEGTPKPKKERSSGRLTLSNCGLRPQRYTAEELGALDVDVAVLSQITPQSALYYAFHSTSSSPSHFAPSSSEPLGPDAALQQLKRMGCQYATKEWVDNHWSLILWKLAGMVGLEPKRESDPRRNRWCWREVIRQLKYRHDRELNGTSRPALRLITTHDASVASPMALCVSNIFRSNSSSSEISGEDTGSVEIELTDGWYRLRSEIDGPLSRAVRKGTLKIGRKIAIVGARFSEHRDPEEILDAYGNMSLKICGNSTHLAPWHAKLGFQSSPSVASLRSLTADGGNIAMIDVVITKTHALHFMEFQVENGKMTHMATTDQLTEDRECDKWQAKREIAASKLRQELDVASQRFEGYAEMLERKAGPAFRPTEDDSAPSHIDDILEDLEDDPSPNETLKALNANESGWLARAIREKLVKDREQLSEKMGRELDDCCPPRIVKNFAVIEVKDAQEYQRRSACRTAHITVWDALSVNVVEGGLGGDFAKGQRYMLTNLCPRQPGAWKPPNVEGIVHLVSTRSTKYTRIR